MPANWLPNAASLVRPELPHHRQIKKRFVECCLYHCGMIVQVVIAFADRGKQIYRKSVPVEQIYAGFCRMELQALGGYCINQFFKCRDGMRFFRHIYIADIKGLDYSREAADIVVVRLKRNIKKESYKF